jgi:hypothetical protein
MSLAERVPSRSSLPNDSGSGTNPYGSRTGTVHLLDFSEKISKGLALRLPPKPGSLRELSTHWVFYFTKLHKIPR